MLVLFSALLISAGCGTGDSRGPKGERPEELTLDGLYERMEQALARPGYVLHTTTRYEKVEYDGDTPALPEGYKPEEYAPQFWTYPLEHAIRTERKSWREEEPHEYIDRKIVLERTQLRDATGRPTDEPLTCRGTGSALLTRLMGCGNYLEESTSTVQIEEHGGNWAYVIATTGELPSHDWTMEFDSRLFVDPVTHLPRAIETETRPPNDDPYLPRKSRVVESYAHEFIPRTSLPADFFDPTSIGIVEVDPATKLQPMVDGMRVYWLGSLFQPGGGIGQLTLDRAGVDEERRYPPGIAANLDYESETRGRGAIGLQEFRYEEWNALNPETGGHIWNSANSKEELVFPDRRAVLYQIPNDYKRYTAHVYFETTVVLITDFDDPGTHSSREAFIAVIEGLRPFE